MLQAEQVNFNQEELRKRLAANRASRASTSATETAPSAAPVEVSNAGPSPAAGPASQKAAEGSYDYVKV